MVAAEFPHRTHTTRSNIEHPLALDIRHYALALRYLEEMNPRRRPTSALDLSGCPSRPAITGIDRAWP
jgi:hypothetical protein